MEHFATHGYEDTRIEEIASEAGVSKGAVFGYFDTKAGLFLAAYQAAARSLPGYLDAPPDVRGQGFFAVLRYWIEQTPHLVHEDWVPYRVTLIGNYCAGLHLRRDITQFLAREDPYGTHGVRRVRHRARRGPHRHRPADDRVHGGLADGPLPGRDGDRGTRPRAVRLPGPARPA